MMKGTQIHCRDRRAHGEMMKSFSQTRLNSTNTQQTHQADKDEQQLYNVCVGHRVETPHQCVEDGDGSRDPDADGKGQVQDHAHGSPCQPQRVTRG